MINIVANAGITEMCDNTELVIEAELETQIKKVRDLRNWVNSLKTELDDHMSMFRLEHEKLYYSIETYGRELKFEEDRLRELTRDAYADTGNKKPAEGVGIRVTKSLQYEDGLVKDWAVKNGHVIFLKLDTSGFEAWYKSQLKITKDVRSIWKELGAVVVENEVVTATISKEL
jgi:hypothetical protein